MTLPSEILADVQKLIHPIQQAVEKAVANAEAVARADLAAVATDVKTVAAAAAAAVKNDAPEVEAAAKAAADAVVAAIEAALAAHGL